MSGDMSPYGVHYGSNQDIVDAFITPFTDVFKTAKASAKKLTTRVATGLRVILEAAIASIIPGISADYTAIFDREQEAIDKINEEYKDVYDRTSSAIGSNDAGLIAFMASPALTLGYLGGKLAAKETKSILSACTAGYSDKVLPALQRSERWFLGGPNTDTTPRKSAGKSGKKPSDFFESHQELTEDDDQKKKDAKGSENKASIKKIVTDKEAMQKIFDNPYTKKMQTAAKKLYQNTLKEVYAEAKKVLKDVNTLEDIEKLSKKKIPQLEELKKLPPAEKSAAEKSMITSIRKSMKAYYVKNLEGQVKSVKDAGIPDNSQYVQDYNLVIAKIKAL